MASAWISEYETMPSSIGAQIAAEPPIASQVVSFTTATESNAFAAKTQYIGFSTDAACHFSVGSSPTATTSTMRLPADQLYFCGVQGGAKISFVTAD